MGNFNIRNIYVVVKIVLHFVSAARVMDSKILPLNVYYTAVR